MHSFPIFQSTCSSASFRLRLSQLGDVYGVEFSIMSIVEYLSSNIKSTITVDSNARSVAMLLFFLYLVDSQLIGHRVI